MQTNSSKRATVWKAEVVLAVFRNTYIAHQKEELTDLAMTKNALRGWIAVLVALHRAVSE